MYEEVEKGMGALVKYLMHFCGIIHFILSTILSNKSDNQVHSGLW